MGWPTWDSAGGRGRGFQEAVLAQPPGDLFVHSWALEVSLLEVGYSECEYGALVAGRAVRSWGSWGPWTAGRPEAANRAGTRTPGFRVRMGKARQQDGLLAIGGQVEGRGVRKGSFALWQNGSLKICWRCTGSFQ